MNRRSFLGRLLGGVAGSALACRVEEVPASALDHLDKVPPICLDFQPNHLWVNQATLDMSADFIDTTSWLNGGIEQRLCLPPRCKLTADFEGPGCMNLFQYLQQLTGKSFTWKNPGFSVLK